MKVLYECIATIRDFLGNSCLHRSPFSVQADPTKRVTNPEKKIVGHEVFFPSHFISYLGKPDSPYFREAKNYLCYDIANRLVYYTKEVSSHFGEKLDF